jgi:hypothetical protein
MIETQNETKNETKYFRFIYTRGGKRRSYFCQAATETLARRMFWHRNGDCGRLIQVEQTAKNLAHE